MAVRDADGVGTTHSPAENTMTWVRDLDSHCQSVQVEADAIQRDQAVMGVLEQETQDLFVP